MPLFGSGPRLGAPYAGTGDPGREWFVPPAAGPAIPGVFSGAVSTGSTYPCGRGCGRVGVNANQYWAAR